MASQPTIDLRRLAQFLGMMGSVHDGEALNAARMAHRLVSEAKLTWPEVFTLPPPAASKPTGGPPPGSQSWHRPPPPPPFDAWLVDVVACLEHRERLTEWEIDFLEGLDRFAFLSEKQQAVLDKIKRKTQRFSDAPF